MDDNDNDNNDDDVDNVNVDKKKNGIADYKNWPMEDIKEPTINDVLYGRGGG